MLRAIPGPARDPEAVAAEMARRDAGVAQILAERRAFVEHAP